MASRFLISVNGIAAVLTPLINFGLGNIRSSGVPSWKIMYFVPGAITVVWGVTIWFVLSTDPITAGGLSPRERYIAVARLRSNNAGVRNTHVKAEQLVELAGDAKFWLCFASALLIFVVNGPVSTFVPTIIHGFGYSALHSLLLSMPHGAYGAVLILALSLTASRRPGCRCWMASAVALGSTLAAVLLWTLPRSNMGGLLFAATILSSALPGYSLLLSLQLANTAGFTKRSASSAGVFIGYCIGNFIGPMLFRQQDGPRYVPGFIVVTITSSSAAVLLMTYRYVCLRHNRKRDEAGIPESFEHAYDDDLTDLKVSCRRFSFCFRTSLSIVWPNFARLTGRLQNPQFRYIV